MDVFIENIPLQGRVGAIPSKSMAHRYLMAAALADSPSEIVCGEMSEDIQATMDCLEAMGAIINRKEKRILVSPGWQEARHRKVKLLCKESGSTLRFLLPVAAALGMESAFYAEGRLPHRPLSPLYEELVRHGCKLSPQGQVPLRCQGQLQAGVYEIPGNISSQYITGLLFALPLLKGDSEIRLTSRLESAQYVDMTCQVLREYGITVIRGERFFQIPGGQRFSAGRECLVEGDWSNGAFWLTAGAMGGRGITVSGLDVNSGQGDRKILEILREMGAKVNVKDREVTVSPGRLRGVEIDAGDIPDLVPVLAAAAAAGQGKTRIYNAGRLRLKESDRLRTVSRTLRDLGAQVREKDSELEILGQAQLSGGCVDAAGDHRIAMMAAVASGICKAQVGITGAEAVNKSYPGFFRDFKELGGKVVIRDHGFDDR